MLSGAKSDSMVQSQVWRSRPDQQFQSLGHGVTQALRLNCGPQMDGHMQRDQESGTDDVCVSGCWLDDTNLKYNYNLI